MLDADKWQEILATLRKNKLRTALTALGVFWGVFMLLVMLGFGNGLQRGVARNMRGFATNSLYVWGQRTSMPFQGLQPNRSVDFDNSDVAAIQLEIAGIRYLAPRNRLGGHRGGAQVSRDGNVGTFNVTGDFPEIVEITPVRFVSGRFLNPLDLAQRRKVAVIGRAVYDQMFRAGEDPIGQHLKINGVYFQVVGLFEPRQTGEQGDRQAQNIHVPFTTYQQAFNIGDEVGWFAIMAEPTIGASEVEQRVRRLLAERHKIHPEDEMAIGSFNAEEAFGKVQSLFIGIQAFIWFVGVVTLLAGVIGVSNIMLIVVKERTKEIGIRKALGARPLSIVSLVIQESVVLTTIAGYCGLVAGVGLLELVGRLLPADAPLADPTVDLQIALIATAILIVAGAFAGVIPATHAARISPIEALRAE